MAEDNDRESKTEEATEKKISDSLERGNTPFSREAPIFASLACMLLAAHFAIRQDTTQLSGLLQAFLSQAGELRIENRSDAIYILGNIIGVAGHFLAVPLLLLIAGGIVASLLQNTPNIAVERITPHWSKISLRQGWSRVFGLRGQLEFVKSVLKLAAIIGVMVVVLRSQLPNATNSLIMEPSAIPHNILGLVVKILSAACVITAILVAADLVWSRLIWRRDLRMTRHEVKEEHKQADGDPFIKMRIRSIARQRSKRRMMAAVPRATLVVTNPTHFAVALRYVRSEGGAPVVVAKGKDLIALKIREIAERHNIPIVEDKPLARALHDKVAVDAMIPEEFYRAVAEIIHFLQTRKRQRLAAY
jgi:flagellar biosynthetic protein FlhB